jgi:diaminohydroxyphosphoribosylaminopyrimidine deaminase/5-amino-6-(5-phosphoribosylamino)uracil reductase
VDAVAVGSETVLVDDPLLTARDVYRERPLTRVVFDRRLRTPPAARLFSTLASGPVIIVTSPQSLGSSGKAAAAALEKSGATVVAAEDSTMTAALRALTRFEVQSVLLEGGSAVQAAAWDEDVVDYVQLFVSPVVLGSEGLPLLEGKSLSVAGLFESKVEVLGPDTLIEGYVHRPR